MSWELINRIDTLNKELKQFGFSLDSSIDEVFEKYYKGELQNEKVKRLMVLPYNLHKSVREVYLSELKKETEHKETNGTYSMARVAAYDITVFPRTADRRTTLMSFLFFLGEYVGKYPPTTTPKRHIELCLHAIARGVELAKFIPQLEREIGNIHIPSKRKKIRKKNKQ